MQDSAVAVVSLPAMLYGVSLFFLFPNFLLFQYESSVTASTYTKSEE